jgi:hypothetical protein
MMKRENVAQASRYLQGGGWRQDPSCTQPSPELVRFLTDDYIMNRLLDSSSAGLL